MLKIDGIAKRFVSSEKIVTAIDGISLDVAAGEFVTLVGPSGCGKSTILNIVSGLMAPTQGTITVNGRALKGVTRDIGYVTQQANLMPWRTLIDNVAFPLEVDGVGKAERLGRARDLIKLVGLAGFETAYPDQLSGGMRQRANIIRTMIYEPKVILMDEPFGPLDAQTRVVLQDLLLKLWERAKSTIVFITHDLQEAIGLGDRVVLLSARPGRVARIETVPLPRPRDVFKIHDSPEFRELYDKLWLELERQVRGPHADPSGHPAEGDAAALAEAARFAKRQRRYKRSVRLTQLGIVIVILAVWQLGGGTLFDPFYLGSPKGIGLLLMHDLRDSLFYRDLRVTATEMGLGYGLGALLGVALGGIFARWRFVADVFDPFFVALNSIPRIALAPLLIIWFGIDTGSKVVLAATLVFFVTFFSTLAGIRNVDSALVNVARVMGADEWQVFFKVQLPAALSWIINGLRLSLPFALIGVIVGEFLVASSGLGYRLNMYSTSYNTNGTFAMIIVMMIFMMCLNGVVSWVEAKAVGRSPADDQSHLHA